MDCGRGGGELELVNQAFQIICSGFLSEKEVVFLNLTIPKKTGKQPTTHMSTEV